MAVAARTKHTHTTVLWKVEVELSVSYVELYGGEIRDLLQGGCVVGQQVPPSLFPEQELL